MGFSLKKSLKKVAGTTGIGRLAMGKSLIGKDLKGMFGGGDDVPGIDTGSLGSLADQTAAKQRALILQQFGDIGTARGGYETGRKALSAQIEPGNEALLGKYETDISGIGGQERAARDLATTGFKEQSFRDVPEIQRMMRNQLAGNRLTGSGAALGTLSQPITQAYQGAADFKRQSDIDQITRDAARSEGLAQTKFGTRQDALMKRLGFDEDTLNNLSEDEKAAITNKYSGLLGVEAQSGADKLAIEQLRQQSEMAQAQAKAAKKSGMLGSIGSIGGTIIGGIYGGPVGAGLGGQLGGMAGNMLGGGGGGQFDPTLMASLFQKQLGGTAGTAMGRNTPVAPANYYRSRLNG